MNVLFEEHPQARSNLLIIIFQLIVWVKISIQETIHFSQFRNLLDTTIQKNYHNKIRLSQRNPYKIKVFLGCSYYTAISNEDIPYLRKFVQTVSTQKLANFSYVLLRVLQLMRRHIVRCGHLHGAEFM